MIDLLGAIEGFVHGLVHGGDGWKLSDMQVGTYAGPPTLAAHQAYTILSISGNGLLMSLGGNGNFVMGIQTDSGIIYQLIAGRQTPAPFRKFSQSVVVSSNYAADAGNTAWALVGDPPTGKLSEMTLVGGATGAHQAYTVLDILGSGIATLWFDNGQSSYNGIFAIQVNGGTIYHATAIGNTTNLTPPIIPFSTSLKVTFNYSGKGFAHYKLD